MKTLHKLLLITLMSAGTFLVAQSTSSTVPKAKTIDEMVKIYDGILRSNDAVRLLDYTYPAVFDYAPRKQVEAQLKQAEQKNDQLHARVLDINQTYDTPIRKFSKGKYTQVHYRVTIAMDMNKGHESNRTKAILEDPKKLKEFQAFMVKMMEATLGKGSTVHFKPNTLEMILHKNGAYIAIEEGDQGWKAVDLSPVTAPKLESILPKEIFTAYKTTIKRLKTELKEQQKKIMEAMGIQV